jgi:hypothetical protein
MTGVLAAIRDQRLVNKAYLALGSVLALTMVCATVQDLSPLDTAHRGLASVGLDAVGSWLSGPLAEGLVRNDDVVQGIGAIVLMGTLFPLFSTTGWEIANSRLGSTLWLVAVLFAQTGRDLLAPLLLGGALLLAGGAAGAWRKKIGYWDPLGNLVIAMVTGLVYLPALVLAWLVGAYDERSEADRAAAITRAVLDAKRKDERMPMDSPPVRLPLPRVEAPRRRPGRQGASAAPVVADESTAGPALW